MNKIHENLKALGQSAETNKTTYENAENSNETAANWLERFPAPNSIPEMNPCGATMALNIRTAEFTSLCPMTGQPDFAEIVIEYKPDHWCVESKSLKLYFLAFRNRRDFHESCVVAICNDLVELLQPKWIKVEGRFTPRGGIPFWPTVEWTKPEIFDPDNYIS